LVALPDNLAERNGPGDLSRGVIDFHPWQRRFFADDSRVIIAVWHRQAGKDFVAAAKAVDDAIRTGRDWYIVSMTQRQADATFAKCRRVADAFKRLLKKRGEIRLSSADYTEYDDEIDHLFHQRSRTLHLPGGGSVTALPGRDPDTLAGLTGCIIFTEFGLFKGGGYKHWRVVFPLSTRGYQVLVISTPRGRNTRLYELASDTDIYSVHTQTILDSVAEGFILYDNNGRPTDVETFRRIYNDEAGWQREFMCEFTGDLEALLKWAILEAASSADWQTRIVHVEADAGWKAGFYTTHPLAGKADRLECGWDVARTGHLSSLWVNGYGGFGARRPLLYLALMHNVSFALQREIVSEAMAVSPLNVGCGDATGLGMDSNETLHTRFGDRWEPVTFTSASRRDMASGLVTAFQDGEFQLPDIHGPAKYIHADLYSLQKDDTGPTLKILEGENPLLAESHSDLAWSAALARRAAGIETREPFISTWTP